MSTDIDVFPSSPAIPTVGEFTSGLRHLLQAHAGRAVVRAVFGEAGVRDLSPLVELLDETPGRSSPARSSDPALLLSMPGYDYGWISLDARRIGFDFYFRDDDPDFVSEYILTDIAPRGAASQDSPATPSRRPPGPDAAGPCARKPSSPWRHACSPGSPPRPLPA